MTSEPSPREVVVKLLMKSSNEKSRRNFNSSRWRRRGRFGLLCYYDGGGGVVLAYSVFTTAAERSFWPTLLFLRRQRFILACTIISMAVAESVRRKSFDVLMYYREKAGNLTTLEPSPREVVLLMTKSSYIYKKR